MSLVLEKLKWLLVIIGLLFVETLPDLFQAFFYRINKPLPVWQQAIVLLVALAVTYFLIRKYRKYDLLTFDKSLLTWKLLGIAVLVYVIAQIGSYFGYQIMIMEGVRETATQAQQTKELLGQPFLFVFLTTAIVSPLSEELAFRGIVFKKLLPGFPRTAVISSAVLFTLLHMPTNFGSFVAYFIPGITFSYVYYKTDKIEYVVASHALNNLLTTVMFWLGFSLN
ncbi:CPBP family intramembrane glutamic endopeptidase [Streptococcus dentiloxodontae]